MSYMKNSMELTKKELLYQFKSQKLFILCVLILGILFLHLFGLHNAAINNYNMYLQTEQMYRENGFDIIESLKEDNHVITDNNSSVSSNPLKEDFVSLAVSIQNLTPDSIISNSLEYFIFVFGTLLFGIYASYIATYDYKYRTHKFFSTRYKQSEILTGKLLSVFLILLGSLFLISVVAYLASPILTSLIKKSVPIENYTLPGLGYESNFLSQLLFSIALLGFYVIVSFTVGFLFKNMFPITIFLLLYTLFIPVLGKYDIKNIFSFFAHKIFSFKARFVALRPLEISSACGIFILLAILACACISLFAVSSNRSSYN